MSGAGTVDMGGTGADRGGVKGEREMQDSSHLDGAVMREAMTARGMSVAELADRVGMDADTLDASLNDPGLFRLDEFLRVTDELHLQPSAAVVPNRTHTVGDLANIARLNGTKPWEELERVMRD